MSEDILKELEAIKSITELLTNLNEGARQRTLNYVLEHLGMKPSKGKELPLQKEHGSELPVVKIEEQQKINDIRSLRDAKKPNSDVEMAALVAYYLSEIAPSGIRKDGISAEDISTYFKQANHPLPSQPRFTLTNARNAGYFESVGQGLYRLNPVGHNLVVHNMPKTDADVHVKTRKKSKSKPNGKGVSVKKKAKKK